MCNRKLLFFVTPFTELFWCELQLFLYMIFIINNCIEHRYKILSSFKICYNFCNI